jgi:hypothetical protein
MSALPPIAPMHNLPEQVTSFIGRERALDRSKFTFEDSTTLSTAMPSTV